MSLTFSPNSFEPGVRTPVTVTSASGGPNLSQCSSPTAGYVPNGSSSSTPWTAVMTTPAPTATTANLLLTAPSAPAHGSVNVDVEGDGNVDVKVVDNGGGNVNVEVVDNAGGNVQVDVNEKEPGLTKDVGPMSTGTLTLNLQDGSSGPLPPIIQRILLTIN